MDYDKTQIAKSFDAGRGFGAAILKEWMSIISRYLPYRGVTDIVDLGCGTGRFTQGLSDYFDANVFAVDPSEEMLGIARTKSSSARIGFYRAFGEALPFEDASMDLIYSSLAYQHFSDPEKVASECHRVLRENGRLCLTSPTLEQVPGYPYVPFFPETVNLQRKYVVNRATIEKTFVGAGFHPIGYELIPHKDATSWHAYVGRIATRTDTALFRISDKAFEDGLDSLRTFAKTALDNEPVIQLIDFFAFAA